MNDRPIYDEMAVRTALRKACVDAGGQKAFAEARGVSEVAVGYALKGFRAPSLMICDALGFDRVVRYLKRPVPVSPIETNAQSAGARPAD